MRNDGGHLADLPRMQREVISETFFQGRKRAEVAKRLGISVNTYDNHLQAAFRALRHLVSKDADLFTEADRSVWYDAIEGLRERYEASRIRRVSTQTRDRSNLKGDRSITEGDGGKKSGADAA